MIVRAAMLVGAVNADDVGNSPPVINMDFSEESPFKFYNAEKKPPQTGCSKAPTDASPLHHSCSQGSWSNRFLVCIAKNSNAQNCPLPRVSAYDHHDKTIYDIKHTVYEVPFR